MFPTPNSKIAGCQTYRISKFLEKRRTQKKQLPTQYTKCGNYEEKKETERFHQIKCVFPF